MSLELPKPIAAYFAADSGDSEAVARCFTDNAVVKDEGRTYDGLAAIKKWKSASSAKYTYTSEPFASEQKDGKLRLPAASPAISLAALLTFDSTSDSEVTRSRRWKSSHELRPRTH